MVGRTINIRPDTTDIPNLIKWSINNIDQVWKSVNNVDNRVNTLESVNPYNKALAELTSVKQNIHTSEMPDLRGDNRDHDRRYYPNQWWAAFWGALTPGGALFAGPAGWPMTDAANFYYDNANDQLLMGDGSAVNPSIAFIGSPGTGMYWGGGPSIAFSINAVQTIIMDTWGIITVDGNVAQPAWSFINEGDSGMYRPGAGTLGITILGNLEFSYTANSFNVLSGSSIDMADGTWIGIDVAGGRIEFDDLVTDAMYFRDCVVTIGTNAITAGVELWIYENNAHTVPAILVEQNGGGDAGMSFILTGGQQYSFGIDNTDDYFKINAGATIGASQHFIMTNTGLIGIGTLASIAPVSLLELYSATANPVLTITGAHATDYDPQIQFKTDVAPTVKWSIGIDSTDDELVFYNGVGVATTFIGMNVYGIGIGRSCPAIGASGLQLDIYAARASLNVTCSSSAQFAQQNVYNDLGANCYYSALLYGSTYAGSTYGLTRANRCYFTSAGTSNTGLVLGTQPAVPLDLVTNSAVRWTILGANPGNLVGFGDSQYIKWGAGSDCGIMYNGTNMVIDTALVGTGNLYVIGTGGGGYVGIGFAVATALIAPLSINAGASNATFYTPELFTTGSLAALTGFATQTTANVSNAATTIFGNYGTWSGLLIVKGRDGANIFTDIIEFGGSGINPTVITSRNSAGAPAARTYTASTTNVQLTMGAAGAYDILCMSMIADDTSGI